MEEKLWFLDIFHQMCFILCPYNLYQNEDSNMCIIGLFLNFYYSLDL